MSLLAGVLLLGLAACDNGNEGTIYQLSTEEKGYSFLAEETAASYKPDFTDTVYIVKLARNFVEGVDTLDLTVAANSNTIGIPTQAIFEDGKAYADIVIDIKGMTTGNTYKFSLAIDSSYLCHLQKLDSAELVIEGIAKTTVSLAVDYTWQKVGVVVAVDDWGEGEEQKVDMEKALEYEHATKELYRLVDLEAALDPKYTDEGYPFQFYLTKETYEPDSIPTLQAMGQSDGTYGNWYWYYQKGFYGSDFVKEKNKYTVNAITAYDGGGLSLYDLYTLEFTWTEGYPLDDAASEEEEEEEEVVGENGFGAIVAGGEIEDYVGDYMAYFKDMNTESKDSIEVSIAAAGDGLVLKGLFTKDNGLDSLYDVVDLKMQVFGGLIYFNGQDFIGKNKYADTVAVYTYSIETEDASNAWLVAGFREDGSIQFTNYGYNEEAVDGLISLYTDEEGTWLGSKIIPCNIVLKPKAAAPATARRHDKVDVMSNMQEAKDYFDMKPATTVRRVAKK